MGRVIPVLFVIISACFAQDPAKTDPKHFSVVFENKDLRVLNVSFGPQEKSVTYSHPAIAVVHLTDFEITVGHPTEGPVREASGLDGEISWVPASTVFVKNVRNKPAHWVTLEFPGLDA
jgi:hypothetical protein